MTDVIETTSSDETVEPAIETESTLTHEEETTLEQIETMSSDEEEAEGESTTEAENTEVAATEEGAEAKEASTEEYKPDLQYKAYGKYYEVPEWAHGLFNKENETELKGLFEKAGGFEELKTNYKTLETSARETSDKFTQLDGVRNQIISAIDSKDYKKAFDMLELKDEELFKYVDQRLNYYEMAPEQRALVDREQSALQQQEVMKSQMAMQEMQKNQIIQQQHDYQMNLVLQNPEVSSVASQYNLAQGNDNAFAEVVNNVGALEYNRTQTILTPQEAVDRAVKMLGLKSPVSTPAQNANAGQTQTTPNNVVQLKRPEAQPVLNGNSSSAVVRKTFSSVDELEDYANTL